MPAPTYPYAYASPQTEVGLALQATHGTPVTPPKFWIPVKSPKYKPTVQMLPDDTLQGSMVEVYNMVPGLRHDTHGWDSYPYLTSFGALLRAELGGTDHKTAAATATTLSAAASAGGTTITTTAALTVGAWAAVGTSGSLEVVRVKSVSTNTATLVDPLVYAHASGAAVTPLTVHEIGLLNNTGYGDQPPAASLADYDGERWRQLATAQMDKLTLKGTSTGLVTYNCDWMSNAATTLTPGPSTSYTRLAPAPGWTSVVRITGTKVQTYQTWEVDMARGTKPIPGLRGSQEYLLFFAGPLTCTGKLEVLEQSGSPQLTAYEAGTVMTLDITFFDTTAGNGFNFHSSKVLFKATGGIDRSQPEVRVSLTLQFLPTSTDAVTGGVAPLKTTVANHFTTTF